MSKARVNSNSSLTASRATVFSGFAMKTDQGALVEFYLNVTSESVFSAFFMLISTWSRTLFHNGSTTICCEAYHRPINCTHFSNR